MWLAVLTAVGGVVGLPCASWVVLWVSAGRVAVLHAVQWWHGTVTACLMQQSEGYDLVKTRACD